MTRTPLDEFMDRMIAIGFVFDQDVGAFKPDSDRSTYIKALWAEAVADSPPGALDGPDGQVLQVDTSKGEKIVFEKRTYGGKPVIEAEGVIVCRMIV